MAATWTLGLVDVLGNPLTTGGLSLASSIKLSYQVTGPTMAQFLLPLTSPEAAIIASTNEEDYYLVAYRQPDGGTVNDRVLKYYGSVWVDEIQATNGMDMLAVTCFDQMAILGKRFTTAQYSPTDCGLMLKSMIDTTNSTDGDTGILTDAGYITASSTIDLDSRTNRPTILSIIQQFSTQQDGCESWMVPMELASGKINRFYAAPRRGASNLDVVFGYGNDTVANCTGMSRVRDKQNIENDVNGYTDNLTSQKTNATSISALRRLKSYVAFTGETVQTVLDNRTQGRLNERDTKAKVAEYRCTPDRNAPALFDDFDLGDTVTLDFRKGVEWQAEVRVVTASIEIDPINGFERLTNVEFRKQAA